MYVYIYVRHVWNNTNYALLQFLTACAGNEICDKLKSCDISPAVLLPNHPTLTYNINMGGLWNNRFVRTRGGSHECSYYLNVRPMDIFFFNHRIGTARIEFLGWKRVHLKVPWLYIYIYTVFFSVRKVILDGLLLVCFKLMKPSRHCRFSCKQIVP